MDVQCSACGEAYASEAHHCPDCGSGDRALHVGDASVSVESSLKLKARSGRPGEVKPHVEKTIKREYWRDGRRWETVERTFDHDAQTYVEEYRDAETGALRFSKSGYLPDQGLHRRG